METDTTTKASSISTYKLVIVGDGACGKTCLLTVFCHRSFPEDYVPTVFDSWVATVHLEDRVVQMSMWDTAGQEEYDRLRPLSYPSTDIVLICASVDEPDSLANVVDKWHPEVVHFCNGVGYFLVLSKADLRDNPEVVASLAARDQKPISTSEAKAVANKIGAAGFFECSAKENKGVDEIFHAAARYVTDVIRRKKPRCLLF
ncbi:Ras like family, member A [Fonticula alba]|uniref:Ras like family, member A n=1 Tax=Fonticula alba TaxID=691883 RepID=A0A058Z7Y1_FONAL|nr:Ras like family, member A [Fonticula alba]KCV69632.1 Ras like family, member A [Fonticula alba]|eukprot:XP_009496197.1 Ras like family, member A [Fonticula alba]